MTANFQNDAARLEWYLAAPSRFELDWKKNKRARSQGLSDKVGRERSANLLDDDLLVDRAPVLNGNGVEGVAANGSGWKQKLGDSDGNPGDW